MTELDKLIDGLPNADRISKEARQQMLDASLIPDADGRRPGEANYVTTYDVAYAAWRLVDMLQGFPVTTSAGSEGTSVTMTAPNWAALKTSFAAMSPILKCQLDVIRIVALPPDPYIKRVPMFGGNDDINTTV